MLRIHFTSEDLARTTIAAQPDPLWEVLLSLHMLQSTRGELVFGAWRRRVRRDLNPLVARSLCALAPPQGYSPDFLTPTRGANTLDESLDQLMSTSCLRVRDHMTQLLIQQTQTPWMRDVAQADRKSMARLGTSIRTYFQIALAPYWKPIETQIAADRLLRSQHMVHHGVDHLLSNLHPRVRWAGQVLEILDFADADVHLGGRGLRLVPSYFCWQTPTKLRDNDLPPTVVYPVQQELGTLRVSDQRLDTNSDNPLATLVGRTRAVALQATAEGCTTTELARMCNVSLAAASHHASILREAGLITSQRQGRAVRHQLTHLGARMLHAPRQPQEAIA